MLLLLLLPFFFEIRMHFYIDFGFELFNNRMVSGAIERYMHHICTSRKNHVRALCWPCVWLFNSIKSACTQPRAYNLIGIRSESMRDLVSFCSITMLAGICCFIIAMTIYSVLIVIVGRQFVQYFSWKNARTKRNNNNNSITITMDIGHEWTQNYIGNARNSIALLQISHHWWVK